MKIKLVSWNLHRCIGGDGVQSVERCAAVLQEIDADWMVLQEVESRTGHELDALNYLAQATQSTALAGHTMKLGDSDYGNAVLTRLPYQDVRSHDLSVTGREPRKAMDVSFTLEGVRIQLVATHLGLRPSERREQVERLLTIFNDDAHDIVLLAGDLNEWWLWGRPLKALHRRFPNTPFRRTWPTRLPILSLDRIWAAPRAVLKSVNTHRSPLAKQASDHLPLVAVLEFAAKS